jgi:hypothetical protein
MSILFDWPQVAMLRCGVPLVILKYMIKECNMSAHNFNVAIVNCNYIFRLLQTNHCQTVHQKYDKEIILHKIISSIKVVHWRIILHVFYYNSHVTLIYNEIYSAVCVFATSCDSWNSSTHSSFITYKQKHKSVPFLKENFLKENVYSMFQEK